MAKQSGLGQALYFNGVDLSNDVGSLSAVRGGPALLEMTGLDKGSHERVGGLLDGAIDFAPFFNPSAGAAHATLSGLPTTDVHLLFATPLATTLALGDPAACLVGKQNNYDPTRAADGMLTFAVAAPGNGSSLEWGKLVTAGLRTDTAATNGTAVDGGSQGTALTVTSGSAANPTSVLVPVAHGLQTGDSVTIAGTNKSALNSDWKVTVVDTTHFTVPCDLSGGAATGGTWTKTSTDYGLAAYHQTTSFTGTSNTPKLQHSADNGVVDTFTDITAAAFTAITSAPDYQRVVTALTIPIRRYVRLVSVGTFNPSSFVAAFTRRPAGS